MTTDRGDQGRLLAIYGYADDLVRVIYLLRQKKFRVGKIFSPTRLDEVQVALGRGRSIVAFFTLLGGVIGGLGLVGLGVHAHTSFNLITWGKPILPWIPWVIVCFEGMVLVAILFNFVTWIFAGRLPQARLPAGYDTIFSGDKFGLVVSYADHRRQEVYQILQDGGAEKIRELDTAGQQGELVLEAGATDAGRQ